MNPDKTFKFVNTTAFLLWILLIGFPHWKYTDSIIIYIVGIGLSLFYVYFIVTNFGKTKGGGFMSLNQVSRLFTDRINILAGWIHYLVFDIMVGMWISHHAFEHGFNRILLIPCLLLTFMFGPIGLFLYLLLQAIIYQNFPINF